MGSVLLTLAQRFFCSVKNIEVCSLIIIKHLLHFHMVTVCVQSVTITELN